MRYAGHPKWYDLDSDLQMLRVPPQEPDQQKLDFLRWLVQTGRLAGDTAPDHLTDLTERG